MKTSAFLKIVTLLFFVCFSTASMADASAEIDGQAPDVACRYQTKVLPKGKTKTKPASADNTWFFWRKADMIQTQDADGDHGEIWERTANGSIQYRKLYHADKTAVEYMPADMPTNNKNFDWFKLSSMLSREELAALKLVKKTKVMGRDAELRQGVSGEQTLEVLWLVEEKLPATITRKDKAGSVQLQLVDIKPLADANPKPLAAEVIADYRHIDAVDFGDMENDPFVKRIMAEEGHHHH